jgi:hypothetical protein
VLTSLGDVFRCAGTRVNDVWRLVASCPECVKECVPSPSVRWPPHVRNYQVVGMPSHPGKGILRRCTDVDSYAERLKRLPLKVVVARPVINPQDTRILNTLLGSRRRQGRSDLLQAGRCFSATATGLRSHCGAQCRDSFFPLPCYRCFEACTLKAELSRISEEFCQRSAELHHSKQNDCWPHENPKQLGYRANEPYGLINSQVIHLGSSRRSCMLRA